jgi:hypothetical protein
MHAFYRSWLERTCGAKTTASSRLSELRRIERYYGDLEEQFEQDKCVGIFSDLTCTTGANPSKIPIDGDLRTNLVSYKAALNRYCQFLETLRDDAAYDNTARPIQIVAAEDEGHRVGLHRSDQGLSLTKAERAETAMPSSPAIRARFIGTKRAFHRYLGAKIRNDVQAITRPHRRKIPCEHCGDTGPDRHAAHFAGRGRPVIINEVLARYTNAEGIINCDLDQVRAEIKAEHQPYSKAVKILCRSCHEKYDRESGE